MCSLMSVSAGHFDGLRRHVSLIALSVALVCGVNVANAARAKAAESPFRTIVTSDGAVFWPLSSAAHAAKPAPPNCAMPSLPVVPVAHGIAGVFVLSAVCER